MRPEPVTRVALPWDHVERTAWTDERLDDFARHVDVRFDAVDRRFDRVEADIRELRAEMVAGFSALRSTLIQVGGGMMVGLIGVIAALIAGS